MYISIFLLIATIASLVVGILTANLAFDLEAGIEKLNVTRLSTLPEGTVYQFKYFNGANHSTFSTFSTRFEETTTVTSEMLTLNGTILLPRADEPDYRDPPVKCETTKGSPETKDVLAALSKLNRSGAPICCQTNNVGSSCTTVKNEGTASLGMCGGPYCLYCTDVIVFLLLVVDECQWTTKVGGQFRFYEDQRLIVFHS